MKEKVWDVDAIPSMKTSNILNLANQFHLQNSCSLNIQLKDYLLWVGGLAKLEHCETCQMPMGMTKSLKLECALMQCGSCHKITEEYNCSHTP